MSAQHAAVVAGVGSWVPPTVVTNDELAARLGISAGWITSRTGIVTRHHVGPGTATSDLAVEAGRRALKAADEPSADAVIVATTTPDRPCPATAPEVAARLGLTGVAAFDVSAVCTGFLYALASGQGLIAAGTASRVLVIGADAYSTIVDPTDRDTAVVFGDGAGAVLLRAGEPAEPGAVGPVVLGSDGEHVELIQIPAGGSRQPHPPDPAARYFQMDGRATFRQAVERMAEAARQATTAAGWRLDEVDRVVAHQANARILAMVTEALDLPPDRQLANIDRVGNTGAASIPKLLADSVARGELAGGDRVLMTAFGGGLTWGATCLTWPHPRPDRAN